MTDFENYKECYKDSESYKLNENEMTKDFGENVTRIMNCENPKERFIATLYLNDSLLEKIADLESNIESMKNHLNCKHCFCDPEICKECDRKTHSKWELAE